MTGTAVGAELVAVHLRFVVAGYTVRRQLPVLPAYVARFTLQSTMPAIQREKDGVVKLGHRTRPIVATQAIAGMLGHVRGKKLCVQVSMARGTEFPIETVIAGRVAV